MKFVISTQEFNFLINKIQNVVSQKPAVPILSNFLIEAVNGKLILTATDLTVGIRCGTEAKIIEEGATTLPAKKLAQLLRELTALNVEVSTSDRDVTEIIANTSRFKLHGMSKNEFPALPDIAGAARFRLKQSDLKEMLQNTSFTVSRDDNRYVLTGLHMQVEPTTVNFEGTDGKRLARAHMSLGPVEQPQPGSYIIPLKAVEEIIKNLGDEGESTLYLMQDKIAVESGSSIVITKLLAGEYPDVSRVIPEKSEIQLTLHREELSSLLRQVALFTADASHSVRFSFMEGELTLNANTMEIGEGKVSMPVNYHGPRLDIAFNPGFFLDILRHTKEESVTLGLTDSFNPGVITLLNQQQENVHKANPLFVIMPMRLQE